VLTTNSLKYFVDSGKKTDETSCGNQWIWSDWTPSFTGGLGLVGKRANSLLKAASEQAPLKGILDYEKRPLVSIDYCSCVEL
jgi:hypothetical protein